MLILKKQGWAIKIEKINVPLGYFLKKSELLFAGRYVQAPIYG